ncbi:MAG TPA: hypothetical protein VED24_01160 [Candidatus Acidoferrum sp.]|nr:hypothetical protein [Candidatus Acidoferrum sp.]
MIIVRLFPKDELGDSWDRILNNVGKISNKDCIPLYISQQEEREFISIMYDVKDVDAFADILLKQIPSTANTDKTRTITLLKPVFFPAPKDRPRLLQRYQVAIRVTSEDVQNVFNHTVHLDYAEDLFPTYAAYSFGEDDILLSMLSVSRDKIRTFVREKIESQEGVLGVDVARIDMSKRIAPTEMWKNYRRSRYLFQPSEGYEEADFTELAFLEGAFVKEPG